MVRFSKDEGDVAAVVEAEGRRAETEVHALLLELDQVRAWLELAASPELRELLDRRRREIEAALGERLVRWRRAGGGLRFETPKLGARPPVADEAELVPEDAPLPEPPAEIAPPLESGPLREFVPVDEAGTAPVEPGPGPLAEALPPAEAAPSAPYAVPSPVLGPPRPGRPSAPPASVEALTGLKSRFEGGGAFPVPETDPDWPVALAGILRDLVSGKDPDADLDAILRVVEGWDRWSGFPPDAQRLLAGHLAARLRTLQEGPFPEDRRIGHAFGILSAFMKKARPGFVSGLARSHRPARETWEADADAFFDRLLDMIPAPLEAAPNLQRKLEGVEALVREIETAPAEARSAVEAQVRREIAALLAAGLSARHPRLIRICGPLLSLLEGGEFRALRRAVRDDQEARDEEAGEDAAEAAHNALPGDWAWWGRTRGRRAVMVGGSPREPNRVRLEGAFGFAELDWMPAEFRRNSLQAVRDRVRAGGVDLVLILRSLVGHDADQVILPACREMDVAWVSVEQGYGVARVRQAIERYLEPDEGRRGR